ncbi:MAG: HDIG domain-containing metalloprotein [Bdellovibrionota bacterium]
MSLLGKNGSKKSFEQNEIHARLNYSDPSLRFLNWVNSLGFEKTKLGQLIYKLDSRFRIRRVALLFFFSLFLCLFLFNEFTSDEDYFQGQLAVTDIKSPVDMQIIDEVATEAKRIEAEKGLPLVFDYDVEMYGPIYARINNAFREMRLLVASTPWPKNEILRQQLIKDFVKHQAFFSEVLGVEVPYHTFEWLVQNRFDFRIQRMLNDAVEMWSQQKIVDLPDNVVRDQDTQLIIREIVKKGQRPEISLKMSEVRNLRDPEAFDLTEVRGYARLDNKDRKEIQKLAQLFLVPNLSLNKQDMSERRKKAREAVLPVQIFVKRNQVIVAAGNPIQTNHLTILSELEARKNLKSTNLMAVIAASLFVCFVIVSFSFLRRYSRNQVKVEPKDLILMGVITFLCVAIAKLSLFVFDLVMDKYSTMIPQGALIYAVPFALAPMLVGMLLASAEIVWIFTLFSSLVMASLFDMNVTFLLVSLIGGIAGARGIYASKNRNEVYMAGIKTGGTAAFAALLVHSLVSLGDADLFTQLIWSVGAAFVGGMLSALLALTFVPLFESVFNYTTEIKLLELSNLNHPLMQQLMMKAPGTYHHCMAVGNMCEAAARDCGANPLLAKVMAYYHDIGKMEHAHYFIENQRPGHNPHDQISPHMSKTILVAHVKDGAEMAIDHKLGRPIVDGILQHHGTTLISYFYNKALEDQDADVTGAVEEINFRYPGPKPQFKEAAIVMLGDSIEATARSLEEPTSGRLNSIVENIIESKFMDGQLDECNLTIQDLAIIKETFKRMLQAIYHQRMDYPHMKDGRAVAVPIATKKNPKKGSHYSA